MTKSRDFGALMKEVERRVKEDESLAKALKELEALDCNEVVAGLVPDAPDASAGRARLPYSSDPVSFDAVWN
jgi:hypothetical protein